MGSCACIINVWSPVMEEKDEQNMVESEKSRRGRPRDQLQEDLGRFRREVTGRASGACVRVVSMPSTWCTKCLEMEDRKILLKVDMVVLMPGMSFLPVSYQRARVVARKTCAVSTLLRLYSAGVLYDPLCFAFGDTKYKPQAPECAGFYKTETANEFNLFLAAN